MSFTVMHSGSPEPIILLREFYRKEGQVNNRMELKDEAVGAFDVIMRPTPLQARAVELMRLSV